MIDIVEIQKILPHRYPFLLIDRVTELEPAKHIVAYKNVTIGEPVFQGHFPGHPIYPGVMIIEGMAQAGGFLRLTRSDAGGRRRGGVILGSPRLLDYFHSQAMPS